MKILWVFFLVGVSVATASNSEQPATNEQVLVTCYSADSTVLFNIRRINFLNSRISKVYADYFDAQDSGLQSTIRVHKSEIHDNANARTYWGRDRAFSRLETIELNLFKNQQGIPMGTKEAEFPAKVFYVNHFDGKKQVVTLGVKEDAFCKFI